MRRLTRFLRMVASPAGIGMVVAAYRSATVRALARHATQDPVGFTRQVARPSTAMSLVRWASRTASLRDVLRVATLLLPIRYVLVGGLVARLTRRLRAGRGSRAASAASAAIGRRRGPALMRRSARMR
jgi:hypothetical protein